MRFTSDVVPLITRLENNFTSYEIEQVANLDSSYAIRLYELLIQWRVAGKTPEFELQDFRRKLGVKDNQYKTMSNLKSRVLEPAVKQINEYTDITAKYEQNKRGRTITGFVFTFKPKKTKEKEASIKRDVDTADMFTVDGLNDKQLGRIARNPTFMAEYNHLVSPTSPAGQSQQGWEFEMVNRLKKDPKQFDKRPIRDYLDY
jgi:plasmid replication initiation protein